MEFGKLSDISHVDWRLAEIDSQSQIYLQRLATSPSTLKIGTPAWGHKEWVNKIYPPKTPSSKYLFYYSRYFNSVELNTTHYRIPQQEQVTKWLEQIPPDFRFCPKVTKEISHQKNGLLDKKILSEWLRSLEFFKDRLGPCFIQMHHDFSYDQKTQLFHFLQSWPDQFSLTLELRNPSWFKDRQLLPALAEYLRKRSIGLVITDVAGRRDLSHTTLTAPWTIIRFIGNGLHPSDFQRLQRWSEHIETWTKSGLHECFFFIHQPDDLLSPDFSPAVFNSLRHLFSNSSEFDNKQLLTDATLSETSNTLFDVLTQQKVN